MFQHAPPGKRPGRERRQRGVPTRPYVSTRPGASAREEGKAASVIDGDTFVSTHPRAIARKEPLNVAWKRWFGWFQHGPGQAPGKREEGRGTAFVSDRIPMSKFQHAPEQAPGKSGATGGTTSDPSEFQHVPGQAPRESPDAIRTAPAPVPFQHALPRNASTQVSPRHAFVTTRPPRPRDRFNTHGRNAENAARNEMRFNSSRRSLGVHAVFRRTRVRAVGQRTDRCFDSPAPRTLDRPRYLKVPTSVSTHGNRDMTMLISTRNPERRIP